MEKTKIILIGGFLGAGKTSMMREAARLLTERGLKTGLITNDQADGLVERQHTAGLTRNTVLME